MSKKKKLLTEDEKLRRRAARKAVEVNAKLAADVGPLFVEQIPKEELRTADDQYWMYRRNYAEEGGHGEAAGNLWSVDRNVDVYLIRRVAQRFMSPKDYEIAVRASRNHGTTLDFLKNVLLGRQRLVLSYWRHVFGCKMVKSQRFPAPHWTSFLEDAEPCITEGRVEVGEDLVWPPDGWKPPLTKEQLEEFLQLPVPQNFPGMIDPLNLSEKMT